MRRSGLGAARFSGEKSARPGEQPARTAGKASSAEDPRAWPALLSGPGACVRGLRDAARAGLRGLRPWCSRTIDRVGFQSTMFLVTVYALVGDDIRLSTSSKPADLYFNIITIVTLLLFSLEMLASCIGKEDYFLSFFFVLDLIATASLILDITWVYEDLILGGNTSVARAGRMSRVGTRAGRVIRVIRLIRLIRIVKLYKHVFDVVKRIQGLRNDEMLRPGDATDEEVYAESRVGQKLSQMTTQKVIVLILSMLIMLPIISVDAWFRDVPTASQYGADVINRVYTDCESQKTSNRTDEEHLTTLVCSNFEQQLTMYIGQHHRKYAKSCIGGGQQAFNNDCRLGLGWIAFKSGASSFDGFQQKTLEAHWDYLFGPGPYGPDSLLAESRRRLNSGDSAVCKESAFFGDYRYISVLSEPDLECPEDLRISEKTWVEPQLVALQEIATILFVFDQRPWMLRTAAFSIIQTAFICFILAVGAMVFSHDANVLVLQPIERMIAMVEKIRNNPLYAMKLGDEAYREKQEYAKPDGKRRHLVKRWCPCCQSRRSVKEQTLETKILENAIVKLGKLLALGFGEAGSEIIVKNMGDDSATVNAMIPGSKVEAVFGFCDIMHFTDTTEVLQDKVMVFVNQVAEIVHGLVDAWHGAPNRNSGQAFLLVWRMREDFTREVRTKVCDMSVISFVQVVAAVNKSAVLKDYREHPALLARIPNYRVRLGFGLHYGWAIEGAIGSDFKIDASYLSPHVSMASRLEAFTRHYGVPILVSEPLARLCSSEMGRYFRAIDHVTLKGGMSTPIRLHAVDLRGECLAEDTFVRARAGDAGQNPFEVRRLREQAKEDKMLSSFEVHRLFETDFDMRQMRKAFPARFYQHFKKGFLNYEAGEWAVARGVFETTRDMLPWPDGPSQALLGFMGHFDFDSGRATPKGWPGYRELTET